MIDYTITVGNLAEISSIIVGGVLAVAALKSTVTNLKNDMTDMKEEMKKVGQVLITMAVTSTRLDNVEQDIRDLKHGRGYIIHSGGNEP
jgi:K+/H+ antiporter YhaU regulatory subunit KhtT